MKRKQVKKTKTSAKAKRKLMLWTPQETSAVRALIADKLPPKQIVAEFKRYSPKSKRTDEAIRFKIFQLKKERKAELQKIPKIPQGLKDIKPYGNLDVFAEIKKEKAGFLQEVPKEEHIVIFSIDRHELLANFSYEVFWVGDHKPHVEIYASLEQENSKPAYYIVLVDNNFVRKFKNQPFFEVYKKA